MKLEITLKKEGVADQLDEKLAEATKSVSEKSHGMATLTHERTAPNEFTIEMKMLHGNFLFDRIILKELKKTMRQIDPEADIRKVK